jgi:hypothetical protein
MAAKKIKPEMAQVRITADFDFTFDITSPFSLMTGNRRRPQRRFIPDISGRRAARRAAVCETIWTRGETIWVRQAYNIPHAELQQLK